MAIPVSPLRYPGGKSSLYGLVAEVLRKNRLQRGHYLEPYAGGAGLALSLLFGGEVNEIHINDVDRSIWSFWHSVLNLTDDFVRLVELTPVTIGEWRQQKEVNEAANYRDPLALGFSTFFLNRTNRSGIIRGSGVIGGYEQKGAYKIDCRFNRDDLVARVRRIAKYRRRIHLSKLDAVKFMQTRDNSIEDAFFCIDPPYYEKGSSLYTNYYGRAEHQEVSRVITSLNSPWILTYDNVPEIQRLYSRHRRYLFDIQYSVQTKRIGAEILIASKGLRIPTSIIFKPEVNLKPCYR